MITYEDQIRVLKETTKDDPKLLALCIKVMEIERDYPNDEKTRLKLIDELMKKSMEEEDTK